MNSCMEQRRGRSNKEDTALAELGQIIQEEKRHIRVLSEALHVKIGE